MTAATEPTTTKRATKRGSRSAAKKGSKRENGPVAQARAIFAKMPRAKRKEVLAACVKAGINPATAATYYQLWKHRNDK